MELVAVPAGRAETDWDRLSSSYRLCLADAQRRRTLVNCRALPRQPATLRPSRRASPSSLACSTGCWTTMYGRRSAIFFSPLRRGTYPTTIR